MDTPGQLAERLTQVEVLLTHLQRDVEQLSRAVFEDGVLADGDTSIPQSPETVLDGSSSAWLITTDNIFQPDEEGMAARLETWGVLSQTWEFEGVNVGRIPMTSLGISKEQMLIVEVRVDGESGGVERVFVRE